MLSRSAVRALVCIVAVTLTSGALLGCEEQSEEVKSNEVMLGRIISQVELFKKETGRFPESPIELSRQVPDFVETLASADGIINFSTSGPENSIAQITFDSAVGIYLVDFIPPNEAIVSCSVAPEPTGEDEGEIYRSPDVCEPLPNIPYLSMSAAEKDALPQAKAEEEIGGVASDKGEGEGGLSRTANFFIAIGILFSMTGSVLAVSLSSRKKAREKRARSEAGADANEGGGTSMKVEQFETHTSASEQSGSDNEEKSRRQLKQLAGLSAFPEAESGQRKTSQPDAGLSSQGRKHDLIDDFAIADSSPESDNGSSSDGKEGSNPGSISDPAESGDPGGDGDGGG